MQSVMSHSFSKVPGADIERSSFDRTCGRKSTFDAGFLVPVFVDEVLPGDTFNLNMTFFARLATPIKPIMDNMYLDSFFFFVPNRLLWTNWQKFNGEQDDPGDSTTFLIPTIPSPTTPGILTGSLADQMGLPVGIAASFNFNALHFRAYNLIYNSWFRDQNLQDSVPKNVGDGPDTYADYVLLRRGKRHDYFTSCLPWPQKATAVSLPLGTSATVRTQATELVTGVQAAAQWHNEGGSDPVVDKIVGTLAGDKLGVTDAASSGTYPSLGIYPKNLYADLSTATAATINSLREAFQLQRLYERDARGGTRYTEILRAHFGVVSPDARLQRPEFLGGGSSPVNINPVAQTTSQSTPTSLDAQGNLAGFGTVSGTNHGFTKSFVEHGVILGLVSVRADLTYQQGLNRMWSRQTRFDFYWPALAHLGEQSVLNQEIFADGTANDVLVFGYQERFAEYRYKPSEICGLFRSNVSAGSTTIDYWHLSQDFAALPTLNTTFIQDTPPVSRVIAVTTEPQFLFDAFFKYHCARPMPVFSVPGLIDHF